MHLVWHWYLLSFAWDLWWPEFYVLPLLFHCNGETKQKCVLMLLRSLTPLGRWQRLIFKFNGNWGDKITFASFISRPPMLKAGRNTSTRKVRLLSCRTVIRLKWIIQDPNHKRQGGGGGSGGGGGVWCVSWKERRPIFIQKRWYQRLLFYFTASSQDPGKESSIGPLKKSSSKP